MSLFDKGKEAALKVKQKIADAEPSFDAATSSAEKRLKALREAPNTGAIIAWMGVALTVVVILLAWLLL